MRNNGIGAALPEGVIGILHGNKIPWNEDSEIHLMNSNSITKMSVTYFHRERQRISFATVPLEVDKNIPAFFWPLHLMKLHRVL